MIKSCAVIKCILEVFDRERDGPGIGFKKFFLCDKRIHPVPGKGHDIPCEEQPEKRFERKPPVSLYLHEVEAQKKSPHADGKQKMADLVRHKPFCSSMRLNSPGRSRHHDGKCEDPNGDRINFDQR